MRRRRASSPKRRGLRLEINLIQVRVLGKRSPKLSSFPSNRPRGSSAWNAASGKQWETWSRADLRTKQALPFTRVRIATALETRHGVCSLVWVNLSDAQHPRGRVLSSWLAQIYSWAATVPTYRIRISKQPAPRPRPWMASSRRVCLLTLITTSTSALATLARPLISIPGRCVCLSGRAER